MIPDSRIAGPGSVAASPAGGSVARHARRHLHPVPVPAGSTLQVAARIRDLEKNCQFPTLRFPA